MAFDFSLWDLALWFAASSMMMYVASVLLAPYIGRRIESVIDIKKLRMVAIVFSMAFIFTVGIRIMNVIGG